MNRLDELISSARNWDLRHKQDTHWWGDLCDAAFWELEKLRRTAAPLKAPQQGGAIRKLIEAAHAEERALGRARSHAADAAEAELKELEQAQTQRDVLAWRRDLDNRADAELLRALFNADGQPRAFTRASDYQEHLERWAATKGGGR